MGANCAQCCEGRYRKANGCLPDGGNLKSERGISARVSSAVGNAYADRRSAPLGQQSVGDDMAKFDEAFDSDDLAGFVSLLSSNQQIDSFEDRLHPWAQNPQTIGALACTQLAILASAAAKENANIKNEIREAGAIPHLTEFLRSSQTDRVQAALVTLSFLTTECPANAVAIFDTGAMELVIKHLESDIVGMRAASATVLRDMYTERRAYLEAFLALDGVRLLVAQLAKPADRIMAHIDVQLEAVLNLQDLIENPNAMVLQVDQTLAREVIECGGKEPLEQLRQVGDADLRASAEELLEMLDGAYAVSPTESSR